MPHKRSISSDSTQLMVERRPSEGLNQTQQRLYKLTLCVPAGAYLHKHARVCVLYHSCTRGCVCVQLGKVVNSWSLLRTGPKSVLCCNLHGGSNSSPGSPPAGTAAATTGLGSALCCPLHGSSDNTHERPPTYSSNNAT